MGARSKATTDRVQVLLAALGIEPSSLHEFLEWALSEHLVSVLSGDPTIRGEGFFARPDALKVFRGVLRSKTGRKWTDHDLVALFDRVRGEHDRHFRDPVPYEEYLKLLWQVRWECADCHRAPPEVVLHIDHVVPASRGGSSKRPNLQFLCADHNLKKSNNREVTGPWLDLL